MNYILLSKLNKQKFKIVDPVGTAIYSDESHLKAFIELGQVANCEFTDTRTKVYKSTDTYIIKENIELASCINQKYNEFIAKTKLLRLDISFKYIIENEDVAITNIQVKVIE